jgi:hypothetical protein
MNRHAVRWARRELKRMFTLDYSKWHVTDNGNFTICGLPIPVGLRGTTLPETDDDLYRVDCGRCRRHTTFALEL